MSYAYSPLKGLALVVEPFVYATRYHLAASDVARYDANRVAAGAEIGALYTF